MLAYTVCVRQFFLPYINNLTLEDISSKREAAQPVVVQPLALFFRKNVPIYAL